MKDDKILRADVKARYLLIFVTIVTFAKIHSAFFNTAGLLWREQSQSSESVSEFTEPMLNPVRKFSDYS